MDASKIVDIIGAAHLGASFIAGLPLTSLGIMLFFIPMFQPDNFFGRIALASLMTICGSYCIIGIKYEDWIYSLQGRKQSNKTIEDYRSLERVGDND